MPERQLNLLKLAAGLAAEFRARAAQVMGRQLPERGSAGVMDDHMPDGFLVGDEFACHPDALFHRPEDSAFSNFRGLGPRIDPDLHRGW